MAKGKKTGGRDFKKGKPGGPGRPRLPLEVKIARKLTKAEFETVIHKMVFMTPDSLKAMLRHPSTNALELMIGSILSKSITLGDPNKAEFILERIIGKVPQKLEHTGANGRPVEIHDLSEAQLDEKINDLIKLVKQSDPK